MADSGDGGDGAAADETGAADGAERSAVPADVPVDGPGAPDAANPDATGAHARAESETGTSAPFVFLLGGLAFIVGAAAFVFDIVTGHDVLRSLAVNAAGALVLVAWAATDTLADPESSVDSRGGAAGTALLLYGIYLLGAGVVVGVSSIRHGRLGLALLCGGGAVVAVLVGLVVFPTGVVVEGGDGDTDDGVAGSDGRD